MLRRSASTTLSIAAALSLSCGTHSERDSSTQSARDDSPRSSAFAFEKRWGIEAPTAGELRVAGNRIESTSADAARARVSLPQVLGEGALHVVDARSGMELRFALARAERANAEIASGSVLYPGAAPGGGDVLVRSSPEGLEDFVELPSRPPLPEVRYELTLMGVAGLRLVANVLDAVDRDGTPRLRLGEPWVIGADRARHRARISVAGCAVDTDPRGPWGRAPVPAGSERCEIVVSFDGTVKYPALLDPAWKTTQSMTQARSFHSMVRLANGKILTAGSSVGSVSETAELFDPGTETWAATASMKLGRNYFPLLMLKTGKVLAAAGSGPGIANSELYDPSTGKWTDSGAMVYPHDSTAGVVMGDGRVLVSGGGNNPASAEVYEPSTGTWTLTGNMGTSRKNHRLVSLGTTATSKVLVVGGENGTLPKNAELYDPVTGMWSGAGQLTEGRTWPGVVRLNDGRILVAGGSIGFNTRIPGVEIYTPGTGWAIAPSMSAGRAPFVLALLNDGRAIAVAGAPTVSSTEIYDPVANKWTNSGNLSLPRELHEGITLTDGRVLVSGGAANFGPTLDKSELFELQTNGASCTLAGECASGFCADGVCCSTACSGTCVSCKAVDQASGTDGVCGPVKAGADPSSECKDDGSPSCNQNGFCDGSGACQKYSVSAGCAPQACTSGSQCSSGHCEDGICCDKACGMCQACTAAKKGFGADGVCENVTADSDPDDECPLGPNYPTSCLADGTCDGSGKCRAFAKDTVSCGTTQCSQGSAEGLLCNGAGQCLTSKKSCEPYTCVSGSCLQMCGNDNDCISTAFCTSQGTCLTKMVTGSACSAGKECQSGYCVDGVCCSESCSGQCESCNIAPNEGTCVAVVGEPIGKAKCAGDGECAGACDGVNRTACSVPPSGQTCGTPGCSGDKSTFSECDGKGACLEKSADCAPFSCSGAACIDNCTTNDDCVQGFSCNPATGNCVPAVGKCLADGITLETGPGETKNCSPYRCQAGECTEPCVTSSQCVSGFACDQGKCVKLDDAQSSDEGGCGCRLPAGGGGNGAWLLLAAGLGLRLGRRRRKSESRRY